MKINLKDKKVLVTGASMGIGKALSECFVRRGANVIIADHPSRKEEAERWAKDLADRYGIRTWFFLEDLAAENGPERLHGQVTAAVPDVHVLVNNAGIAWYGRYEEMPVGKLETMVKLNCLGYAKMCRLFLPTIIRLGEGGILNISSVAALTPVPTETLYSATKYFVQGLTEAVRSELRIHKGIVVSTLNPPFTKTHLLENGGYPSDLVPLTRMKVWEPDVVASLGVEAFVKGKILCVPGIDNQILYFLILRLMPRRFINWLTWFLCRRESEIKGGM
ncbi:MAG: SDR family NAD(P)-dependent oxidoreductase [Desulfomonilia bacterium]|jgi:hypothetical protein